MELHEILASLPRGKEDKPLCLPTDDLVFDPCNIDGAYYNLDPAASGCVILMFSKAMDPSIFGRATLDGVPLPKCVLRSMPQMGGLWVVGIGVRGYATQFGKQYTLHVEGFCDTDGNEMNPQDFVITVPAMEEPQPRYAEHEMVALRAAREGIVLLKNNGVLPLACGSGLNLFGKGINRFRTSASGAGEINPRYRVSLLDAAEQDFVVNRELAAFYNYELDLCPPADILERAVALSNTAVMLIERGARENRDNNTEKGCYYLTAKTSRKPQVVDLDRDDIFDEEEVYPGCYVRATLVFFPYNNEGKGVGCLLNNVQKLEDGERIGGGAASAAEDFDDEDDLEDEDDDLMQ